ncbi:MAG: sulfatase-like hydrolase/transferase, partial [Planctomycetaceae bacterium]|nr:sulfatase-like hydrolase/transferase [Planctomycetaceae bacterium]
MSRSTINFFSLRILLFCILTGFTIPLAALAEDERPNVIVIMSDDQGGGDYGFQGNPLIETPSLDTMFENGGCLTNFYVSPVCAPTRA